MFKNFLKNKKPLMHGIYAPIGVNLLHLLFSNVLIVFLGPVFQYAKQNLFDFLALKVCFSVLRIDAIAAHL